MNSSLMDIICGSNKMLHTWKTLGADTRQARAEDRVAPKIPAVINGA